jgi:NADH dehydrogenase
MGLREEKKQQTRQAIMEAAVLLFRERGYDATRVKDIIEEARVSEGTFFNYFPTKDSILHELSVVSLDALQTALRFQLEQRDRSVSERLRETFSLLAGGMAEEREIARVLMLRSSLMSAEGLVKQKEMEMYDLLAELFRAGQKRGEIVRGADPYQLAEMLMAIWELTTINWLLDWWEQPHELEPRVMQAVELFLSGCAAHRPRQLGRQPPGRSPAPTAATT